MEYQIWFECRLMVKFWWPRPELWQLNKFIVVFLYSTCHHLEFVSRLHNMAIYSYFVFPTWKGPSVLEFNPKIDSYWIFVLSRIFRIELRIHLESVLLVPPMQNEYLFCLDVIVWIAFHAVDQPLWNLTVWISFAVGSTWTSDPVDRQRRRINPSQWFIVWIATMFGSTPFILTLWIAYYALVELTILLDIVETTVKLRTRLRTHRIYDYTS